MTHIVKVDDVRQCAVVWLDEMSTTLRVFMGSHTVYEGNLKPGYGFDFVAHAGSLGAVPDDPREFVKQIERGLKALADTYHRYLH